jgi:K+-transporting ATPase KdpF subunit
VGFWVPGSERAVLRGCDWVYVGVRTVAGEGETGMIETVLLGFVTVLLLIYLVYALLRPEKF